MTVLLVELIIVVVVLVVLRAIRGKITFFRGGYVIIKDHYKDDKSTVRVEDMHFFRNKENENRSLHVQGTAVTASRIPLDPKNQGLMIYGYCAPILSMLNGTGTQVRRTLTLGGGGGAVPRYILQNYDKAQADIVEINADSIRVSKEYFLKEFAGEGGRANMIHADAKDAVRTLQAPYQFVFCDLYSGGGVPSDLVVNPEFVADLSRLCGGDGLLAINGSGLGYAGVRLVLYRLLDAFEKVWVMMSGEGFVIFARNKEMPALDNLIQHGSGIIPIYPSLLTKENLHADFEKMKNPTASAEDARQDGRA